MRNVNLRNAVTWALVGSLAAFGSAIGAPGGGGGGGGGGGNKPPFEVSNNLAYPSVVVGGGAEAYYDIQFDHAVLGTDFSYGCPDTAEGAEYPNLSCANDLGTVFYEKDSPQCVALCGASAERMFFQKVSGNVWSAETIAPSVGINDQASHVDWGDALESRTSAASSVVRVETMPFYMNADSPQTTYTGYEMWHAYGLGRTEMWGLRVDDSNLPYSYVHPFAIIRTTNAKLLISKLGADAEACPTVGVEGGSSPYKDVDDWTGSGWASAVFNHDPIAYTPELNISGKYVYGYNWMLKTFDVDPADLNKAGWWRLTFYTEGGEVVFRPDTKVGAPWNDPEAAAVMAPASLITGLGPRLMEADVQLLAEEEGDSSSPLYVPVISPQAGGYNLTYIDICLSANKGGGSKGRRTK